MGVTHWINENWFPLLQSLGIVGSLIFAGLSFRLSARTQQGANLLAFKEEHRKLWSTLYLKPELNRVIQSGVNVEREPVTQSERLFVDLLITHLQTAHELLKRRLLIKPSNLDKDTAAFFSLPIPGAVWKSVKATYDAEFVRFVDGAKPNKSGLPDTLTGQIP